MQVAKPLKSRSLDSGEDLGHFGSLNMENDIAGTRGPVLAVLVLFNF